MQLPERYTILILYEVVFLRWMRRNFKLKYKKIAIFNHKGGVSKTTSTFNIGWKLAELGHRTLLVDCDPQCNLTGLVLEYSQQDDYAYDSSDLKIPRNIRDAVARLCCTNRLMTEVTLSPGGLIQRLQ